MKAGERNIVLLDKSAFYPFSGGQQNDIGTLEIDGQVYQVLDCQKIGKCVLHFLDKPLGEDVVGKTVRGQVDAERRNTLRCFHTGTHIVFAACRRVLGPHIWQNGAKKTETNAHLDVTHFASLTNEQEMAI
jgi:alanyl-tRNA synthetase